MPDGYTLTRNDQLDAYRRSEEQVRGFQPLYQKLTKAGIKSEKDWDAWDPLISTAKARKINAAQFAAMFSEEADADIRGGGDKGKGGGAGAGGGGGGFDIEDLRKQAREEARGEFYTLNHEQASKGNEKVIAAAVDKFLGDGEHTDYDKAVARGAVKAWMEDPVNRPLYSEGHPLRDKAFAPFDESNAAACLKHFADLKAQQKGKDMTAAAKAASAGAKGAASRTASVLGGGGAASGKANTKNATGRSGGRPSIEEVESAFAARKAARGE